MCVYMYVFIDCKLQKIHTKSKYASANSTFLPQLVPKSLVQTETCNQLIDTPWYMGHKQGPTDHLEITRHVIIEKIFEFLQKKDFVRY